MDTKKLGIKFESNNRIIEVGKGKPFRLLNIDGIESSDFELFIEDNIFHDGSRVNHKRVKGRPIMIEAEYVGKHKEVERRKLASFFNVHRNGYLIINYQGIVRKIKYEVESFKAPLRNLYEPLKFLLHIYCPDPYWLDQEKTTDIVTWIPNLEFDAVEGFSTEQTPNTWIETAVGSEGLQVFKKGTIYLELEEESTVPEVEIAYLLENGQYKRLKQQATVFSTGTGYDENGNYVDVSDSIVNGQVSEIKIEGKTYRNVLEDYFGKRDSWAHLQGQLIDNDFIKGTADGSFKNFFLKSSTLNLSGTIDLKPNTQYTIFVEVRKNTLTGGELIVTDGHKNDPFGVRNLIAPGEIGIFKFLATTKSDLTNTYPLRMFIRPEATSGEIEFRVMLLEGDYTNENISYIRGTKSTLGAIRLKSVGKNLFDFKKNGLKLLDYTVDLGDNYKGMPIKLIPNTTYTVQRFLNGWEHDTSFLLDLWQQQGRIMLLNTTGQYASFTFTTDSTGIIYLRHRYGTDKRLKSILSTIDIMLQIGETATPYEPYKESVAYITAKDEEGNILELHSLPNGVKDEINVAERKLIKRTKKIIFDGSENWTGFTTAYADTNGFYRMKIDGWVTQNKAVTGYDTGLAWNDLTTFRIAPLVSTGGSPNSIGFYTDGNLYLLLPRDYIDANYSPTLDGMKQYLNDHPITLIYQLAEPIVKLLPPEPLTPFEEFESGFGVGEAIEFGYRLTRQIVEIENIGDVDAPIRVVFRAHGQVEKPYIQDVETREILRINRTLQAGDVLEITTEFGNKNVYLNGEKAHHYLDFLNSTWLQLKPGINLIKYGAENGVELLECRLFYTPRYLGV